MDIKTIFISQYIASLEMVKNAAEKCPDDSWNDPTYKNKFWHIAYHSLFFTHLYLQDSEERFVPWGKHRDEYQFLGPLPWPPYSEPKIGEPYNKGEILEYYEFCRNEVEPKIAQADLEAESGFFWLPFTKMELQIYNIRHIQHHVGQLIERLRARHNIAITWVGMKPN